MSLPASTGDEAAMRALDRKCAVPDSVVSKRTVRQLAAQSLPYKESFVANSSLNGLGNLVRCALEAGVSPDTTTGSQSKSLLRPAASSRKARQHCAASCCTCMRCSQPSVPWMQARAARRAHRLAGLSHSKRLSHNAQVHATSKVCQVQRAHSGK
jgi:hypothetical protein